MQSKVLTVILAVVFVVLLIDRLAVPLEGTIICGVGDCFCMAYGSLCGCSFEAGCLAVCFEIMDVGFGYIYIPTSMNYNSCS